MKPKLFWFHTPKDDKTLGKRACLQMPLDVRLYIYVVRFIVGITILHAWWLITIHLSPQPVSARLLITTTANAPYVWDLMRINLSCSAATSFVIIVSPSGVKSSWSAPLANDPSLASCTILDQRTANRFTRPTRLSSVWLAITCERSGKCWAIPNSAAD
jgi:hypothetical protein